eukprot:6766686-Ditylum_brightwellii.AAC.1
MDQDYDDTGETNIIDSPTSDEQPNTEDEDDDDNSSYSPSNNDSLHSVDETDTIGVNNFTENESENENEDEFAENELEESNNKAEGNDFLPNSLDYQHPDTGTQQDSESDHAPSHDISGNNNEDKGDDNIVKKGKNNNENDNIAQIPQLVAETDNSTKWV